MAGSSRQTPDITRESFPSGAASIQLTIRFATSLPDLPITIVSPATTSVHSLKRQVRCLLPPDTRTRHLRFIHAGKVLSDVATVKDALQLRRLWHNRASDGDQEDVGEGKGKGKAPMRDIKTAQPSNPVYVHCSIGDVLSPTELAHEAEEAESDVVPSTTLLQEQRQQQQQRPGNTNAVPRGFDRLLGAGFTAQEISILRAQFLQLQSYANTPDTMPTAAELRLLEDRWIDESAGPGSSLASDGFVGGMDGGDGGISAGSGLDDMLMGNVLGFFWPIGALVWLLREEGVWSSRRQMAVFTGILVNVAFSVLRATS